MLLQFILVVLGFALLIGGANLLVGGASNIAQRFGIPERVIGLTIVAVGTAMPELMVSITSAIGGHADMAFGNVMGSCMANLLLIMGLSAVIQPLGLSRRTQRFEIPVAVISVVALLLLSMRHSALLPIEGALLFALFVAFVVHTVFVGLREGASGHEDIDPHSPAAHDLVAEEEAKRHNPLVSALLIVAGIALLKFGADFVVDNSTLIAGELGMSERVVGITVVALGTCLPELVTSVVAAYKGNTDLAVGNVIGSNITNILLVMGVPAMFAPIPFDAGYLFDFILLAVCSGALLICAFTGTKHVFSRQNGIVYVLVYVVYIMISLIR